MLKKGLYNSELNKRVAKLGHLQTVTIADLGLPINNERVDLSYDFNKPGFIEVLSVYLREVAVDKVFIAKELKTYNQKLYAELQMLLAKYHMTIEFISHTDLKLMSNKSEFTIRTGEASAYANIILQSGVIF